MDMKKVCIFVILLMMLSGCTLSKNKENNIEDNSVGKIDVNKEYVNETLFKSYKFSNLI